MPPSLPPSQDHWHRKIGKLANVTAVAGDANDRAALAKPWADHDAAVSSIHFLVSDVEALIGALLGRGRALIPPGRWRRLARRGAGIRLVIPAHYRAEAEKGAAFLARLQQETELSWTFLSPSALIDFGNRTAKFRLGTDGCWLIRPGWLSFEDFAVATADEIERPADIRKRFNVGY